MRPIPSSFASACRDLLRGGLRPVVPSSYQSVLCLQKHLRTVKVPTHRNALTSLLCEDHSLGIEQFRRRLYPDRSRIPPECRICRYCKTGVETEVHALFRCAGPKESRMLQERRSVFMERVENFAGRRLESESRYTMRS
ncbi:hypothetical protein DFP72DRAFT_588421 [Ephemerocybe angulata]|uniref:Uncharacterized protein n=1 Tax=Ephemerocybe angulata TaxID=980116 RepID=A0A8H6LYN6_9AGAR|nr:hypothetical protein DFP72DRAFT_588421 [Tulosesus angulatus]